MLSAETFEGELHVSGQQSKGTDRMLAELLTFQLEVDTQKKTG